MSYFPRLILWLTVAVTPVIIPQATMASPPETKAPVTKSANSPKDALIKAAMDGNTTIVQALLEKGMSPNTINSNRVTLLALAAMMDHPVTVKLLLDKGADVNVVPAKNGNSLALTPLMIAARGASNIILGAKSPSAPKGYDADPNFEKKHPEVVQKWNAEMDAWAAGYEQIVQMLLEHGADVNAQATNGLTAIEASVSSLDPRIVQMLLDHGARLDVPIRKDGRSNIATNGFIAVAATSSPPLQNDEILKLLLDHGAKPDSASPVGMTPLGEAASSGDIKAVGLLLKAGAAIDARDNNGKTALMYAQSEKHQDVVSLLRQSGAKDSPANAPTLVTAETNWARIDYPGVQGAEARGINIHGQVIGNYHGDDPLSERAFLLSNGGYTKISFPKASSTRATGINDAGDIVGQYYLDTMDAHGFLWSHGAYTTVTFPNSTQTMADGINAQGQIVGSYLDSKETWHFFLLNQNVYTTIDPPKMRDVHDGNASISNDGQIAGYFENDTSCQSFLFSHGKFMPVPSPRAQVHVKAYAVNNLGQVVGELSFGGEVLLEIQPFLWNHGSYAKFTVPDAISPTSAQGINDLGQFVGSFIGHDQREHGYVMKLPSE